MSKTKIRVVIADDQAIYREGLQLVLGMEDRLEVVGEAASGRELVAMVERLQPDVVLTDIEMPGGTGIEATQQINQRFPEVAVIALSMHDEEATIMDMIDSGALGYLVKYADKTEIYHAIETVFNRQPYYCRHTYYQLTKLISRNRKMKERSDMRFTDKEVRVIVGICDEMSNQEMAKQMFVSKRTIDGYRSKILEKLQLKSAIGVVKYAIKEGIYKL